MIYIEKFAYQPSEHESEKASNSYLMSLIAVVAGLPLPIINLLATFFFYIANRKGTYYTRWHCTQALVSQLVLLFFNSAGFWWTISVVFEGEMMNNSYISYMIVLVILNAIEFITTMYTATKARQGVHVVWWLFGDIANYICKDRPNEQDLFKA